MCSIIVRRTTIRERFKQFTIKYLIILNIVYIIVLIKPYKKINKIKEFSDVI